MTAAASSVQVVWLLSRLIRHVHEQYIEDAVTAFVSAWMTSRLLGEMRPGCKPVGPPEDHPALMAAAEMMWRELLGVYRGPKLTLTLLKLCNKFQVPPWIRVGSLAAACATARLGYADGWPDGGGDSPSLKRESDRELLSTAVVAARSVQASVLGQNGMVEKVLLPAVAAAQACSGGGGISMPMLAAVLHGIDMASQQQFARLTLPILEAAATGHFAWPTAQSGPKPRGQAGQRVGGAPGGIVLGGVANARPADAVHMHPGLVPGNLPANFIGALLGVNGVRDGDRQAAQPRPGQAGLGDAAFGDVPGVNAYAPGEALPGLPFGERAAAGPDPLQRS